MENARPGITRRTALKTAAWSAPVIAAAAASPLAAASGNADLDLGVSISPASSLSIKSHGFSVKVADIAGSGATWNGTFDLEYFVAPDDSALFIASYSNVGVASGSTPGWSYVSTGQSGPNGPYSLLFTFSGIIASGGAATLIVSDPYYVGLERSGPASSWPSSPYTTDRAALISNVAGTPNSDTGSGNTTTLPTSYVW